MHAIRAPSSKRTFQRGWMPISPMASRCAKLVVLKVSRGREGIRKKSYHQQRGSGKNMFQLHGAAVDGAVMFGKKLSRSHYQRFGPAPRITISASGPKSAARTGLTRVRTRSHAPPVRNSLQTERHPQEKVRPQSCPLRHLPSLKRSPDPAAAGFFRCFRGLCGRG